MVLRKGFTLVELVVVVAIIGILVTIAVPKFTAMTDGAKEATFEANHRILISAVSMYVADNGGDLPTVITDLDPYLPNGGTTALLGDPPGATYTINSGALESSFVPTNGGATINKSYTP